MEICRKNAMLHPGQNNTLVYYIVVNDLKDFANDFACEIYGAGVTIVETGETEIVSDVTFSKNEIFSLIKLLSDHLVTPVAVSDVVSDWLCQ
ncbi:DUF6514 family protein [Sporobacter termitidis]|nr:DUF6514 family protein [Sporobacter termitidis]